MDPKTRQGKKRRWENASSEEIRSDIKGTRREMDETLDEMGERLHPRHLLDEVIDIFRSSPSGSASRDQIARTSKRLGRTVANELRKHPLPALLAGAGLVWWIVDARQTMARGGDFTPAAVGERFRRQRLVCGRSATEGTTAFLQSRMVDDDDDRPGERHGP